MVVTSSVAGIGPAAPGRDRHRGGRLPRGRARADLRRLQARGRVRGAGGGRARGGRGGDREPVVRARRAGRPLPARRDLHAHDRQLPARPPARRWWTATRTSSTCATWPRATCAPRRRGGPGERYILGGHDIGWVELIERVAELSGVRAPGRRDPARARRGGAPGRVARAPAADLGRGARADGAELALLLAQGARRAGLPPAQARHHAARHHRLVPRADRGGRVRHRAAHAAVPGRAGDALRRRGRAALRRARGGALRRVGGWWPALDPFFPRDEYFMRLALREAERALEHDDVPVGCVVAADGEVVAAAPNERELRGDPTAHCEVLALREAAAKLGSWRLDAAVLYVTLEPCAMCAGAIVLARVPRVVYGAHRPEGRRGGQRARRARRAAAQPPPGRGRRAAGRGVGGAAAGVLRVRGGSGLEAVLHAGQLLGDLPQPACGVARPWRPTWCPPAAGARAAPGSRRARRSCRPAARARSPRRAAAACPSRRSGPPPGWLTAMNTILYTRE